MTKIKPKQSLQVTTNDALLNNKLSDQPIATPTNSRRGSTLHKSHHSNHAINLAHHPALKEDENDDTITPLKSWKVNVNHYEDDDDSYDPEVYQFSQGSAASSSNNHFRLNNSNNNLNTFQQKSNHSQHRRTPGANSNASRKKFTFQSSHSNTSNGNNKDNKTNSLPFGCLFSSPVGLSRPQVCDTEAVTSACHNASTASSNTTSVIKDITRDENNHAIHNTTHIQTSSGISRRISSDSLPSSSSSSSSHPPNRSSNVDTVFTKTTQMNEEHHHHHPLKNRPAMLSPTSYLVKTVYDTVLDDDVHPTSNDDEGYADIHHDSSSTSTLTTKGESRTVSKDNLQIKPTSSFGNESLQTHSSNYSNEIDVNENDNWEKSHSNTKHVFENHGKNDISHDSSLTASPKQQSLPRRTSTTSSDKSFRLHPDSSFRRYTRSDTATSNSGDSASICVSKTGGPISGKDNSSTNKSDPKKDKTSSPVPAFHSGTFASSSTLTSASSAPPTSSNAEVKKFVHNPTPKKASATINASTRHNDANNSDFQPYNDRNFMSDKSQPQPVVIHMYHHTPFDNMNMPQMYEQFATHAYQHPSMYHSFHDAPPNASFVHHHNQLSMPYHHHHQPMFHHITSDSPLTIPHPDGNVTPMMHFQNQASMHMPYPMPYMSDPNIPYDPQAMFGSTADPNGGSTMQPSQYIPVWDHQSHGRASIPPPPQELYHTISPSPPNAGMFMPATGPWSDGINYGNFSDSGMIDHPTFLYQNHLDRERPLLRQETPPLNVGVLPSQTYDYQNPYYYRPPLPKHNQDDRYANRTKKSFDKNTHPSMMKGNSFNSFDGRVNNGQLSARKDISKENILYRKGSNSGNSKNASPVEQNAPVSDSFQKSTDDTKNLKVLTNITAMKNNKENQGCGIHDLPPEKCSQSGSKNMMLKDSALNQDQVTVITSDRTQVNEDETKQPNDDARAVLKDFYRIFRAKEKLQENNAKEFAMGCLTDQTYPESVHWRIYLELADLAKRENNISEARRLYLKGCTMQPNEFHGWLEYSKLEEECGNLYESSRILKRAMHHCPMNETVMTRYIKHEERVAFELKDGDLSRVRQTVLAPLIDVPIDKSWQVVLEGALMESRSGNFDVARNLLKYLMLNFHWYGPLYLVAFRLERDCGRKHEAMKIVEEGLKAVPRYGPLWFGALRSCEGMDMEDDNFGLPTFMMMVEKAVTSISKELIWKVYLEAAQAHDRAAFYLQSTKSEASFSKQLSVSRRYFAKAVTSCPSNLAWKVWLAAGRMELSVGRVEEARDLFFKSYQSVPPKSKVLLYQEFARLEEIVGKLDLARAILRKARSLPNADWKVWLQSVSLETRNRQTKRAISILEQGLNIHVGTGRLWAALIQLKQPEGVDIQLDILKRAISAVPKSGEVWCEGARIFLNPFSPTFHLDTASLHLDFSRKFTPQYGDSFLETIRYEMIQKLSSDELKFIFPTCLCRSANTDDLNEWVNFCFDEMMAYLERTDSKFLEEQISYHLSKINFSELNLRAINADPNYGKLWFHCRNSPSDTASDVLKTAIRMIEKDVMENIHFYLLAILRRKSIENFVDYKLHSMSDREYFDSSVKNTAKKCNLISNCVLEAPTLSSMLYLRDKNLKQLTGEHFIIGLVELNKEIPLDQLCFVQRRRILFGSDLLLSWKPL